MAQSEFFATHTPADITNKTNKLIIYVCCAEVLYDKQIHKTKNYESSLEFKLHYF